MSRLRLDPWPADYEGAVQMEETAESSAAVDSSVEMADWRALSAENVRAFERVFFVDGVRRVEARVLTETAGGMSHGLFGSLAVGAVLSQGAKANFHQIVAARYLVLAGEDRSVSLSIGSHPIEFRGHSYLGGGPADAIGQLQNLMRTAEAALARTLTSPECCVFADGPLQFFDEDKVEVVGVVKRIFLPYLAAREFALVYELKPGERTPLFSIEDDRHQRYAWYQRLAAGRRVDHALAGIVRLEMRAAAGLDRARRLADFACSMLPRYISSAVRDPRAPQNLLPVGALEEELRRHLGDPLLIRRAIEMYIASAL